MDITQAREKFRDMYARLDALGHAMGILNYDAVTGAPEMSDDGRGRTMGVLSDMEYGIQTDPESLEAVEYLLEHRDELTPLEVREITEFNREREFVASIPQQEYVDYTVLVNKADSVWHRAKPDNDFKAFEPYLRQIFDTNRRFALYYKPDKAPYDTMLDMYERGLTTGEADRFFAEIKAGIVPLLERCMSVPQVRSDFLSRPAPLPAQKELSKYLMDVIGIDPRRCVLAETEHPFTDNYNKNDVRITTHYYENAVVSSMYSVIHEGGHALYELHSGDEYEGTCLAGGVSMGIHESQSRFYENIIGRSREFINLIYPKCLQLFPGVFGDVTPEEFFRGVNRTEPSLIRTEADELTYCLHIMVRYEIEKEVIAGTLDVSDIPEAWRVKYKEYLGIDVPDDRRGCLQDSHWSGGAVGYFPSYALGSAYGAQMLAKMQETVDVPKAISGGNLSPIAAWLEDRIWRHGCMYDPDQLLGNALEAPFDPKYYVDYLKAKYEEVYGL